MKVRFCGNYWTCECGFAMLFLDPFGELPQRRISCNHGGCQWRGSIFLEPLFNAELATESQLANTPVGDSDHSASPADPHGAKERA